MGNRTKLLQVENGLVKFLIGRQYLSLTPSP